MTQCIMPHWRLFHLQMYVKLANSAMDHDRAWGIWSTLKKWEAMPISWTFLPLSHHSHTVYITKHNFESCVCIFLFYIYLLGNTICITIKCYCHQQWQQTLTNVIQWSTNNLCGFKPHFCFHLLSLIDRSVTNVAKEHILPSLQHVQETKTIEKS